MKSLDFVVKISDTWGSDMTAFSAANVAKALERVPCSGSSELQSLFKRAQLLGISDLVAAIEAELRSRGPIEFTRDMAERHAQWSEQVIDLSLEKVIEVAFRTVPLSEAELRMLMLILERPGITYRELEQHRGKGDAGLVLGHFT